MFKSLYLAAVVLLTAGPALAEATVLNDRALFPEGPLLVDGRLFYAEYAGHVVTVWDGTANVPFWGQGGCGPSAVVPVAAGYAITCYDSAQIVVISDIGQLVQTYDADAGGLPLTGPNDGTPDGQGGAWLTLSGPWDSGPIVGRVVHLAADGRLTTVADDLHYANGIAVGADGRLYVNESEAGRVISFAVAADGSLSDRRLFVRLTALGEGPGAYPDGLKAAPGGGFFIGQYSSGRILQVAADGSLLATHDSGATAAPNMVLSADGATLFVMAVDNTAGPPYEGRVLAMPLD